MNVIFIEKPNGRYECSMIILTVPQGVRQLSQRHHLNFLVQRVTVRFGVDHQQPARSVNGHIHFFNPSTLQFLFQSSGFSVQKCRTYGFKRGLRNHHYLPQKKNSALLSSPQPESATAAQVSLLPGTRHGAWYYHYRYFKVTMGLPGLLTLGLDYLFWLI